MGEINMAGDWIKFEIATPDKSEVWLIASALNIDPDAVIGKLLRVWIWFDQHSENGNADSVTKMLLNREVGNAGFCDAMIRCGWMIENGDQISLKDFSRHNGKSAKTRANTALRVAQHKIRTEKKGEKTNAIANATLTPSALPREEKRREKEKDIKKPSKKSLDDSKSELESADQKVIEPKSELQPVPKPEPLELTPPTEQPKAKKPREKKTREKFVVPTFEELKNYFREKGAPLADDHERFFDHHEKIGWVYGKHQTPIVDWKAAARTWIKNSKTFSQNRGISVPPFYKNQNPKNRSTRDISISEQVTSTDWATGPSMFDAKTKPAPPAETGNLIESTDFAVETVGTGKA